MSFTDTLDLLEELILVAGGVVLSRALIYATMKQYRKLLFLNSTLGKISQAKDVHISDLRSLLSTSSECESESSREMLVIVRGIVKANPGKLLSFNSNILTSQVSKQKCVVLEQTWGRHPSKELPKDLYEKNDILEKTTSLHKLPFILRASGQRKYVSVNLEDSSPSPPMTLVFDVLQEKFSGIRSPTRFTSSTEFLLKEKILPVGKELNAIGICSLHQGIPQIKACKEIPCFLSELTKGEMSIRIRVRRDQGFLIVLFLGIATFKVLRYTLRKIWHLWKRWKRNKRDEYSGKDSRSECSEKDTRSVKRMERNETIQLNSLDEQLRRLALL